MRQRITATAGALALALMLLVNFRSPHDLALATATNPGSNIGGATRGTAAGAGAGTGSTGTGLTGATGSTGSTRSTGSAGTSSTGTTRTSQSTTGAAVQYIGPVAPDPYGNVQVEITVQAGKIVDVTALAMPIGGHSGRISNFVAPILRTQALSAQSARINGVSGATYTSIAYASSLQGALDQAGL